MLDGRRVPCARRMIPRSTRQPHPERPPRATPCRAAKRPGRPHRAAIAAQHPLPAAGARLTGGLLHDWQRRNATASMPLALHQLVVAGNLDNLQLAIRAAAEPAAPGTQAAAPPVPGPTGVTPPPDLGYHGPVFMDSDIYKTLEAIGWELGRQGDQDPARDQAPGPGSAASAQGPPLSSAFADFAATTIELLARVQRPDGYLNSYVQASGEPPLPEPRLQPRDVLRRPLLPGRDRPGQGRRRPGRDGHRDQARRPPGQGLRGPGQGPRRPSRSSRRPWSSCTARRAPPPTVTWPRSSSSSGAAAWRATPASAAATCKITSRSGSGQPRSATRCEPSTWRRA